MTTTIRRPAAAAITAVLLVLLTVLAAPQASAQFGPKNKISYQDFDWMVYHSPHFDIHYYSGMEPFLEEVVSYVESAYVKISTDLDHELRFRVPLVIYRTHGEFRQTNILLTELPQGVAAFAEAIQNRMVLPIDLPPDKLYQLIAHELTHIFEYSLLYDGYLGRALRSNPPTWLMEGLASYLADDEDNFDRMAIRDAVVNNILPPLEQLSVLSFLTYRYGHAIFDYIEQEHGEDGLRTFIFEYRKVLLSNNLEKAIKESFGYGIDTFDRRFNRYLRKKYFPVLLEKKSPDEYGREIGIGQRGAPTRSPTLSPSGELIAALAAPNKLELDLVVLSADDGELVKNLTAGWSNRYQGLVSQAFSGRRDLSWSPVGDQVVVFGRRENKWPLMIYDALSGKKTADIIPEDIVECASPAFSADGRRIAFEGNRNGVVDLFEIDLDTREIRNLTNDEFFDANPWYAPDGTTLLYNRRIGEHWKVFSLDLDDPTKRTQLTYGPSSDVQPTITADESTVWFSSDRRPHGVFNIYSLDLASGNLEQHTDVVGGCFTPLEIGVRDGERRLVFSAFFEGGFRLYRMPLGEPEASIAVDQRLADVADVEPFKPPLSLRVDPAQTEAYRLKWDVDAPSIAIGVTDDGTFLSNAVVQFSDLLGNHRVQIIASSVSDFANFRASYFNLKRRYNWGATAYDTRDYFLEATADGRIERDQTYRETGVQAFIEYPLNRYWRLTAGAGAMDESRDELDENNLFRTVDDTYATVSAGVVADTTRYQQFGAYQGKRLSFGVRYGPQISGNSDSDDLTDFGLDFRTYKKATRRSLLAFRVASIFAAGDRELFYGMGGVNQLRGYEFREFVGSRLLWSNLEFRFPLIDLMQFPKFGIRQIRGFFFADAGAAWASNDRWYDARGLSSPLGRAGVRVDETGTVIPFDFWDSENDRPQDLRASYGTGIQFGFIGGLQFNWVWSKRLDYTAFVFDRLSGTVEPTEIDGGPTRMDFYIAYNW